MEEDRNTMKLSCVKYFDALWFCYCTSHIVYRVNVWLVELTLLSCCVAPVHQLKRYYVHGDIDDCIGHWGRLMACMKQKTRFQDDDDVASLETPCLWEIRTSEQAAEFWKDEFVHNEGSEQPTV
jgi:hypothetical protein